MCAYISICRFLHCYSFSFFFSSSSCLPFRLLRNIFLKAMRLNCRMIVAVHKTYAIIRTAMNHQSRLRKDKFFKICNVPCKIDGINTGKPWRVYSAQRNNRRRKSASAWKKYLEAHPGTTQLEVSKAPSKKTKTDKKAGGKKAGGKKADGKKSPQAKPAAKKK